MPHENTKKRKRNNDVPSFTWTDTTKPTATFKAPNKGREYTVSVALPGSIIANAQTHDLKTSLAGTIARALTVFTVDEVVIFDDSPADSQPQGNRNQISANSTRHSQYAEKDAQTGYTAFADPSNFLHHVLTYLETPPYLRRALLDLHPNLRTAGSLPSLDAPHHLSRGEWCAYREGVTMAGDGVKKKDKRDGGAGKGSTLVNAGLSFPCEIPVPVPPNVRVTLRFESEQAPARLGPAGSRQRRSSHNGDPDPADAQPIRAQAVHPSTPRTASGYYWGYTTRITSSLSAVLTESPYASAGGYDFVIGTSERGAPLSSLVDRSSGAAAAVPKWKHALVCFGGPGGLEVAVRNDPVLGDKVREPSDVFDAWVDLFDGQGQGSRTVRTEEAVWIGLMGLKGFLWDGGSR